jgi:hypothetical protein
MDTKFHEDFNFPVCKLYDALEVLSEQGPDAYTRYCNKVDMPMADRKRVESKHLYHKDSKFRAKIKIKLAEIKIRCGVKIVI